MLYVETAYRILSRNKDISNDVVSICRINKARSVIADCISSPRQTIDIFFLFVLFLFRLHAGHELDTPVFESSVSKCQQS